MNRSVLQRRLRPLLDRLPGVRRSMAGLDTRLSRWQHSVAEILPGIIRPQPRQLTVAVTAACNLRCKACRYGRDFMVGERLSLPVLRDLLDDARAAGVNRVRLYGGEPLLHPDLPEVVRHSTGLGMDTYLTTNALLLGKSIDKLYAAGLRWCTIGFYGVGDLYDDYTQRPGHFNQLRSSLDVVRSRYGDSFEMQLNFVLIKPTCNLTALYAAFEFATTYELFFHIDLYGYSMPFFNNGPDGDLLFTEADRRAVQQLGDELVRLKQLHPKRLPQSLEFVRSVPDWLLKGRDMRVPCDAYELLWVGADGSVQLCDVTFPLGNLKQRRLREILFGNTHRQASRDAFQLKCPNCTCKSDSRIRKHAASVRRYRG
jgi:MoaA/NifB/PqqE/SkfB family radical SAM enzyme